jgi:hypothetical protein
MACKGGGACTWNTGPACDVQLQLQLCRWGAGRALSQPLRSCQENRDADPKEKTEASPASSVTMKVRSKISSVGRLAMIKSKSGLDGNNERGGRQGKLIWGFTRADGGGASVQDPVALAKHQNGAR